LKKLKRKKNKRKMRIKKMKEQILNILPKLLLTTFIVLFTCFVVSVVITDMIPIFEADLNPQTRIVQVEVIDKIYVEPKFAIFEQFKVCLKNDDLTAWIDDDKLYSSVKIGDIVVVILVEHVYKGDFRFQINY
jgi:hypothetical protein